MRALRVHDLIGPAGLGVDDVPIPAPPDPDAVLVDVHAAGIGFVDTLVARGRYQVRQQVPYIPGMELSGVIAQVPDGSPLRVGQAVVASTPVGACAEKAWVPGHLVAPLAPGLSFGEGAAMVINYQTAMLAFTRRAPLRSGDTVLVHGAGGGLGSACVQIAHALSARVTAVAGTEQRRDLALAAGADVVLGTDDWFDVVRATDGMDVIVDPVGGDTFDRSIRCLASEGRLLTMGFTSGRIPEAAANRLLLRNAGVLGVNWGGLLGSDPGLFRRIAEQLDLLVAAGLRPPPPVGVELADAAAAFAAIEDRQVAGKVVVLLR